MKKNPYLLPDDVEPTFYKIWLKPDLKKFVFSGNETVHVKVNRNTRSITLHAVDLKIKSATVSAWKSKDGLLIKSCKATVSTNKDFETATLKFGMTLKPEHYVTIAISFTGELNDKMHGFYRTNYKIDEKDYFGAATQFESTDARRCFPCWDEPSKKAKFRIFLKVPAELTAVSNMPIEKEIQHGNGLKTVSYMESPLISSYLVCFVVAHLKCIEGEDKNGVVHRVWAIPGKETHGKFALLCSIASAEYYEKLTGISYASIVGGNNPKLDMIACPDFASGAMENLGAVTYRETASLIDPENDTAAARERVGEVVDHENAHMWFGDLVTMKWWNGLWLNEGFATFMSHHAMHDEFPEWDIWIRFVAVNFRSALHLDSLKNSHPIEIDVQNPYEIREIFDEITYAKGSVVNRMCEQYLGDDFWKGLQIYLKRFSYKNADTVDLWTALEEASGKPVRDIMARYTKQPGYPVVEVSGSVDEIVLLQQRFLADGSKEKKSLIWNIPITILTSAGNKIETNLSKKCLGPIAADGSAEWLKLNPGQSGFYRVAYCDDLWNRLILAVMGGEVSKIDRIGLLDDSLALAKAGYMKTSQALDMLRAQEYDEEFDGNVWSVVISNLNSLAHILEGDKDAEASLANFAKKLLRPIHDKLGWEKIHMERHTDVLLRSSAIRALCSYKDFDVVCEADNRFSKLAIFGGPLDPDLKAAVYASVAENGGMPQFDALVDLYDKTDDAREKERIQVALGCFKSQEMAQKVIEFSLSDSVRKQDWFRIMIMLGRNPDARPVAWNFIKENWNDFHKKYEGNLTLLVRTLEGVTSRFVDEENLSDVKKFFRAHPLKEAERTMKQVVETIETNLKWRDRALDEIKNWLALR